MSPRIDAHNHFWRYTPQEYGWLGEGMKALRRDFLPGDLEPEMQAAGIDGVISVQARQSLEETRFLLDLAGRHDFIRAVVGWVPLVSEFVGKDLEALVANPKLRGVRHVLQDESDEFYILREDFNRGVGVVGKRGLVCDILVYEHQLPLVIAFVDRHPGQAFVLDHIGKPRIRDNVLEPWASNIRALAQRENVSCKLSGLITEAHFRAWTENQLQPYFDIVLEVFSPGRLLFGSDWPVCLAAGRYAQWHEIVRREISSLSPDEQAGIMGRNACRIYGLNS